MTFLEALVHVRDGLSIKRHGWTHNIHSENGLLVYEDGQNVDLMLESLEATDWVVVPVNIPVLLDDQGYMYFNTEKNRWISTTNPQKHIDAGHRVAIFSFFEEL